MKTPLVDEDGQARFLRLRTLLSLLIASPMVEMRSTKLILSVLHDCLAFQTHSF